MKLRYDFIAGPDDKTLHEIMSLFEESGWAEGEPAEFYRRMIGGSVCFLIARYGGETVGMARAIGDGVNDAYIQDVFVAPACRRRGIAAELVRRLVAELKTRGLSWIALVASGGTDSLYRRCGFEKMRDCTPMIHGSAVY
ncbi:MAG: GNAT family N-acetyltransferase [Elusimicrobiaceae bacterium]|nr:GNAT family N-acetyltransferase [Elusimicrobiaceae bacterium]